LIRPTRSLPTQSIAATASSRPSAHVQTLRRGYALATGAARTRAVMLPAAAIYKERHTGRKRYLRGSALDLRSAGTPRSACHPILQKSCCIAPNTRDAACAADCGELASRKARAQGHGTMPARARQTSRATIVYLGRRTADTLALWICTPIKESLPAHLRPSLPKERAAAHGSLRLVASNSAGHPRPTPDPTAARRPALTLRARQPGPAAARRAPRSRGARGRPRRAPLPHSRP